MRSMAESFEALLATIASPATQAEDMRAAFTGLAALHPDPRVVPALAEIARGGTRKRPVYCAVRALCAIDRPTGARLGLDVIRRVKSSIAEPLARLLGQRCPEEAHAGMLELAASARLPDRVAAMSFLRCLPAARAVPLLIDMYRREKHPMGIRLLRRLLKKRVRTKHRKRLENLREELTIKAEGIAWLLGHAGPEPEPERPGDGSSFRLMQSAIDYALQEEAGQAPTSGASLAMSKAGQTASQPQPPPAAPVSLVPKAPPRHHSRPGPVPPAPAPRRRLVPLGAATVLGLLVVLRFSWPPADRPTAAVSGAPSGLGAVGSRVTVAGEVRLTGADGCSFELAAPQGRVRVRFLDRPARPPAAGARVQVTGVLRAARGTEFDLMGLVLGP